ncbi:hypothetical protein GCM10010191_67020 [Actinomadura vinacea]|uniref:YbaB/EbfC family DNA-binding protein n=1 Tax=Actinomadura vinacea TaxID=115336 RepID=A0ABN3JYG3_9ACTN
MFDFDPANFRIEDLHRLTSQADEMMKRLNASGEEVAEMVGEGESADGLLRATVDSGGRLKELTINPRAMRKDSQTLAEELTAAITAAQDDVQGRSEGLINGLLAEYGMPANPDTDEVLDQIETFGQGAQHSFREHHDELGEIRRNIP